MARQGSVLGHAQLRPEPQRLRPPARGEADPMTLAEEVQRYLAVVEFFRAEGCEPHWRPERDPNAPVDKHVPERRKSCPN
jgi:hypothetical protein